MTDIRDLLQHRILVIDGAMGTMIQRYKLEEADYRGERFKDWPTDIKGNNDLLCLTQPHIIREKPVPITATTSPTQRPSNDRRLRITPATAEQQDLLSDYILNFETPLRSFDSGKLQLTKDSLYTSVTYSTSLDSQRKQLRIKSNWTEATRYNLKLEKDFATDTLGKQLLKTDTLFFTTKKLSEYVSLTIKFTNLNLKQNPILQFVQNSIVVRSVALTSDTYSQSVFQAGEYDLRILYDLNSNGKWDPGSYFGTRWQPELVRDLGPVITVKPDWKNDYTKSL